MSAPLLNWRKFSPGVDHGRTEYTICSVCRSVNKINVEARYGITHEFHEKGACLIKHPDCLLGRYRTTREAEKAMRLQQFRDRIISLTPNRLELSLVDIE